MGLADISGVCSHNMRRTTERSFSTDGLQSSLTRVFTPSIPLFLLLLFEFLTMGLGTETLEQCGGFFTASGEKRILKSPAVTAHGHCIWVIDAVEGYQVAATFDFKPVKDKHNSCQQLEVRDETSYGDTVYALDCEEVSGHALKSQNHWLFISYESHMKAPQGALSITFNREQNKSLPRAKDPLVCYSYEFTCPNKICLPYSARCDGHIDCGVHGRGDDEAGCFDRNYGGNVILSVGASMGIGLMIIVVITGYCLDKRHNWDNIAVRADSFRRTWGTISDKSKVRKIRSKEMPDTSCNEQDIANRTSRSAYSYQKGEISAVV